MRTMCFWWRSTCCSSPSPASPPLPCPDAFRPGACTTCSTVKDNAQIFLAVVGDTQWGVFCEAFGYDDLASDPRTATNNDRVRARSWLIPLLRERLAQRSAQELAAVFEAHGLPFAPITDPQHLFEDPHLQQTGGLAHGSCPMAAPPACLCCR